ncbi:Na+/H+ antiporter [Pollutimonas bauzanensis]|uniref:Sodium/proton antiporter, CPA1 family n=1 Tax=Pollutimonas bauzanensis TaxID=658167 RepID=A0A1M5TIP5_9BURK|nr:Na+/H+ antiporter [Pollutimonas bauzanensis]SHH50685.1 sodium/proton antiporter, CPA1 family [Pollutimonas bauzanensis]
MQVVTMVLVFLLAVVVSGFIARLLPLKVPLPLLQIAVGAGLSYGVGFDVTLDPDLFFLLFIPPLLFLDGWRIPKGVFFREWKPILTLAIGLVVFTVVGIGFLIDWMIPAVPLAVAFALAAILSPTDPVAVSAMTANSPIPSRLTHILEGESLLNDATGLVCFSFAVAAAVTGAFSIASASMSFVVVAGGGLLIGLAVTWIIGTLNRLLIKRAGEEPAGQILISLLIPFAAYLAAEHMGVSGILAAAVAGIAMHYSELAGHPLAATRMQRTAVWDTVQAALNGVIFIILGEQLPRILRSLPEVAASAHVASEWQLLGYLVAITLALGVLRFVWVWISLRLTVFNAALRGETMDMPKTRLLLVTATAGVRGAITLAGILTLPLLMPDGTAFPMRDMAIFLAMGVILLSLLIASVGLPLLTRGLGGDLPKPVRGSHEDSARIAAAEAAIRRIEQITAEPLADAGATHIRAEAAAHLLDVYQRRLDYGDSTGEDAESIRQLAEAERHLRIQALRAERDELYRLRRTHSIDDSLHQQLMREIDLMEASLTRKAA